LGDILSAVGVVGSFLLYCRSWNQVKMLGLVCVDRSWFCRRQSSTKPTFCISLSAVWRPNPAA